MIRTREPQQFLPNVAKTSQKIPNSKRFKMFEGRRFNQNESSLGDFSRKVSISELTISAEGWHNAQLRFARRAAQIGDAWSVHLRENPVTGPERNQRAIVNLRSGARPHGALHNSPYDSSESTSRTARCTDLNEMTDSEHSEVRSHKTGGVPESERRRGSGAEPHASSAIFLVFSNADELCVFSA